MFESIKNELTYLWRSRPYTPKTKTIYTLDINNEYPKAVTDITYPLMKHYAEKIGANFHIITERKFPEWLPVYEKFQIYELCKQFNSYYNIFLDCDALVHPDTPDVTKMIPEDTVAHHGVDYAGFRWKYDKYLTRDGRHIGSCNWFTMATIQNRNLWKPVDDMTQEEISNSIRPIINEVKSGVVPIRLIDDYVCSRNIAKYGLKFTTIKEEFAKVGFDSHGFFWHIYAVTEQEKMIRMEQQLKTWGLV